MKKKIIYSAITGDYEDPLQHTIPKGWEYRLYSDKPGVGTHLLENPEGLSAVKLQRKAKILPWELFDFDVCVWIDGNTIFDPNALDSLVGYDFAVSNHPERDCIYHEAQCIIEFGKDTVENIMPIVMRYAREGYPEHNGLCATHALIRKNTQQNRIFCEEWWNEVKNYSHRDQMSFNYVLWKHPIMLGIIKFKTIFKTVSIHRKLKSRYKSRYTKIN